MHGKILVALDGSQTLERVLPHRRSFAKSLKTVVEFLQVVDPKANRQSRARKSDLALAPCCASRNSRAG
jgi:nucleotide-binding universal stress UspA family protein